MNALEEEEELDREARVARLMASFTVAERRVHTQALRRVQVLETKASMILAKQLQTEHAHKTLRADTTAQPKDIAQLEKTLASTQASADNLKTKLEAARLSHTEA